MRRTLHAASRSTSPSGWLSGGLLCSGVIVVILVVGFVGLFISGLWQAQTAVAMAKEELMPHIDRLLNATDLIVADAQASLAHVHTATESGSVVASGGAASILTLLNASAGAARQRRRCCAGATLARVNLGDGVSMAFPGALRYERWGVFCMQTLPDLLNRLG